MNKEELILEQYKLYSEQKERFVWEIDKEIPIFTQDRNYIERFV